MDLVAIARSVVFVLFLVCSFILLNAGFVIYGLGKEPLGWLFIATGLFNIVVSLLRKFI